MPAAARPILAGCALLVALLLWGCGGGGPDGAETTAAAIVGDPRDAVTTVPQKPIPKHGKPAAGPCQIQLGSFVASMDSLRRRLAVGVTYDQYVAEVRGIHSTYRKIPTRQLEIDCLDAVGTPAEQAFNRYIEAANDWGGCVAEAGCSSETVEPVLQRGWRIASHFLSAADDGLDAIAP